MSLEDYLSNFTITFEKILERLLDSSKTLLEGIKTSEMRPEIKRQST